MGVLPQLFFPPVRASRSFISWLPCTCAAYAGGFTPVGPHQRSVGGDAALWHTRCPHRFHAKAAGGATNQGGHSQGTHQGADGVGGALQKRRFSSLFVGAPNFPPGGR